MSLLKNSCLEMPRFQKGTKVRVDFRCILITAVIMCKVVQRCKILLTTRCSPMFQLLPILIVLILFIFCMPSISFQHISSLAEFLNMIFFKDLPTQDFIVFENKQNLSNYHVIFIHTSYRIDVITIESFFYAAMSKKNISSTLKFLQVCPDKV